MRDDTPVWQLTVGELKSILKNDTPVTEKKEKKLVYGLTGIAELFNCSMSTAHRIKKSGKINKAITQVGRKIVVDAELALQLHNH
jgi:hypothetical protein